MEIQEGITITTPEPETPQADPSATAARESVLDTSLDAAPLQTVEPPAPASDPLDELRADMREEIDVLADGLSTLTCHLINTQITAYRERRRALLAARKARHEVFQLRAAVAAASKVTVSTSLSLAALDTPVAVDAAPEPPELLAEITSQVADYVMFSERASVPRLTTEWYDDHTLAYLRKGWPQLSPVRQEAIAVHLINEVCQPPKQRNVAWVEIVRAVQMTAGGAQ